MIPRTTDQEVSEMVPVRLTVAPKYASLGGCRAVAVKVDGKCDEKDPMSQA